MMSDKRPLVSIVIVNHNGRHLMEPCLSSLSRVIYPKSKVEIIVVDNCSQDGSVEFIRDRYKNIRIIENKENNYCRANNLGMAQSHGEFIVFLNNDVWVTEGWLQELVRVAQEDGSAGIITSKLLKEDGTVQNAGLYELPNFYWGERGAGKNSSEYDIAAEVDAVSCASALCRRRALEDAGSFDEDFVMFGEDVDMSLRLKKKGWKLIYSPDSVAYHRLHGSCSEAFAREAIEKNRLLLIAKHFPRKLSNALLGSGYFTVKKQEQKSGKFFDLMPLIFLKLVKEHEPKEAYEVIKEVFIELKRIVNFENNKLESDVKNIFNDLVETRKDRDRSKNDIEIFQKELDYIRLEHASAKEELNNLIGKLKERLDAGLAKDNKIIELTTELDSSGQEINNYRQELNDYKEEAANLANKLRDSLDGGLTKDNRIFNLSQDLEAANTDISDYKEETANLSNKLKDSLEQRLSLEKELNGIYDSEGFRFILSPIWKIMWFSRHILKYLFAKSGDFLWNPVFLAMIPVISLQGLLFILCEATQELFGRFFSVSRKEREVLPFDQLSVSIVIPDWNGIDLLKKCLSSIFESDGFREGGNEVLVVDDCSSYDIAESIKADFPKVRVIRNKYNKGFGRSCNIGIRQARGELIVLLNNDIMVSKEFLDPLRRHFRDEEVFAVAPKLYGWDKKTFNYGMQMGRFSNGYLNLWNEAETGNGDKISETSPTVFAVGGAVAFRKKDFLWLGGFDDIYRPNCWEDIDISYRAQKRGLKVLYEPKSIVYHKGAATLNYVRHKEIKNELLFMWKNLTDRRMLFSHLINLPKFLYRGKHSTRITFLIGYLWALSHFLPVLISRLKERPYLRAADRRILNKCMLYYRNFKRNNYSHARKKTILLITPFMLYPLNCGGKLRIFNLYKRLSKKYNLILLTLVHHEDEKKHAPFLNEIFKEVRVVHTKTPSSEFFLPGRYKYSFSRFLIEELEKIQDKMPIDIVHIESNELLYLSKYIKHIPLIYTEHDISILSYRNSYYHKNVLGGVSEFIDYLKLVYYHSASYKNIDHVIVLSKEDKKVVKAFSPQADSSLIATGVDLGYFKFREKSGEAKSLVFVGHYPHYPNEEAAVYFCRKIFPLVRKEIPGITLKLVGSCPTEEVIRLSKIEGVELIGEVPDVNPYLQEASCFVTAFKRSAGIRGKVLEAMATGTPVVSTARGAFGIDAQNRKDILIADKPQDFAKCIIELLTNGKLYRDIAANARKLVEDKYDWDKIVTQLDSVYQQIMQERIADAKDSKEHETAAIFPEKDNHHTKNIVSSDEIAGKTDDIINACLGYLDKQKESFSDQNPQELHIELTHACNSRCIMCDIWDYHKRNDKGIGDEFSAQEIGSLVKKSKYLTGVKTVVLSGGEPFLRKDIVEICDLITKAMPQAALGVLTNGLDTENTISRLKEILEISKPKSLWVGSSLDGLGDAYDKIRGTKDGFKNFVDTIGRIKRELPQVKLSLTFVLTPFNIEQLLPCWEFAQEKGLDFLAQFGVSKPARSPGVFKWDKQDFAKIKEYADQIAARIISNASDSFESGSSFFTVSDKINLLTKIYYWRHLVDFQQNQNRFFAKCSASSRFAMLDPYGNLFFCPILKEKTFGTIRKKDFDSLWVSKDADSIRSFIDGGNCSCWLVCTVFPVVDRALTLYGDKVAQDLAVASRHFAENQESGYVLNNEECRNKEIILRSFPQGITLGSNYKCNANCMFCLGGEYKPFSQELFKDYFEPKAGPILKQAGHVSFCGMGELLLIPEAEEFLDYINKSMPVQNKILTTNGLSFSSGILERLTQGKYSVQISLHASNPALHNLLTGVKGGFERIVKDIRYITSRRRNKQSPYVTLVFLVNTLNIEGLPNFVEMASSLNVDAVSCNYLTIFKDAHIKLSCFFKQGITNEMFDIASRRAQELGITLILPPVFSQDNSQENGSYFKKTCSQPWKEIYIDTEGAVLPCCYSGEHFGELRESGIADIWNNSKYRQLRTDLASGIVNGMCKYCINSNPANVNLLDAHVSFRPEVQREILSQRR